MPPFADHPYPPDRLVRLIDEVVRRPFYGQRYAAIPKISLQEPSLERTIQSLPFLTKRDLVNAASNGPGLFDLPPESYVRWHQTSGTSGRPFVVRDTADDWQWWIRCWQSVLDSAAVTASDVALMAFSFGPFIGFWTANDAFIHRGTTVIPGGGLSTRARIGLIIDQRVTVLCATPTYALHLAAVAAEDGIDLAGSDVRQIIVAGEPGGSIAAVRTKLQSAFGAQVTDHAGGSEIGAWGFGDAMGNGLFVNDQEFIAEVIDFSSATEPRQVDDGETGELVLTGLGRVGGPAIRYRTGDMVCPMPSPDETKSKTWFPGGVIGRADDMVVIRGVNVFPSSIEAVVREQLPTQEYRVYVDRAGEMDQLSVEAECDSSAARELSQLLSDRLSIRIPVQSVPPDSLPRFEAKSRRWKDRRYD